METLFNYLPWILLIGLATIFIVTEMKKKSRDKNNPKSTS